MVEFDSRASVPKKVLPRFKEKDVVICLVSSEEYARFVSVVIQSIFDNSIKSRNYDIIILTTNMTQQTRNILLGMLDGVDNFSLRFVEVDTYVKNFSFYTWAHFTVFTYYRLLIPSLLSEFDKVIYLDSDIVVNSDISELYDTDVEGYLLAAARDTHVIGSSSEKCPYRTTHCSETLGFEDVTDYFQGGVVIYNIKEMALKFPDWHLIKKASESTLKWLDQDFLNLECKGHVKYLPCDWNVMVFNNPNYPDENYLEGDLYAEYFSARDSPKIIHYVGRSMPCFNPFADLYWYFWKYARNTPYYEIFVSVIVDVKVEGIYLRMKREAEEAKIFNRMKRIISSMLDKTGPGRKVKNAIISILNKVKG